MKSIDIVLGICVLLFFVLWRFAKSDLKAKDIYLKSSIEEEHQKCELEVARAKSDKEHLDDLLNQAKEREKHIFQLYGTLVSYCIEHSNNSLFKNSVHGVFVTSTVLSPMARKVADWLHITVIENHEMVDFPRIKCNIGKDESGKDVKIYHLPMDLQYDSTKIDQLGEFYAFTVQEAVDHGFRRTFKWHGSK